jgi:hypothetical protein
MHRTNDQRIVPLCMFSLKYLHSTNKYSEWQIAETKYSILDAMHYIQLNRLIFPVGRVLYNLKEQLGSLRQQAY